MERRRRGAPRRALAARLLAAAAPCAGGSPLVLRQYKDGACEQMAGGVGSQQSWVRMGGEHSYCYDLLAGFACQFRCYARLVCEYGSGSGVIIEDMSEQMCLGQVKTVRPLAAEWTWLQAATFFKGGCVPHPTDSTFLKFDTPMGANTYPNCSRQGATSTDGDEVGPNAFQGTYTLQFYNDEQCQEAFEVSTFSTQTSSRFRWQVYRGVEYCYDYIDETPRNDSVVSSRFVPQSVMNFKLVCGNTDMLGNGIRIQKYEEVFCSGRHSTPEDWRAVFYPMNFPLVSQLFDGQCVRWGSYYVKFDQAWQRSHYPDCTDYACTTGYCAGGRIMDGEKWSTYSGPIQNAKVNALTASSAAALGAVAAAAAAWLCVVAAATNFAL